MGEMEQDRVPSGESTDASDAKMTELDATDLVARLRARLAEHEADPRGRAAVRARWRALQERWRPSTRRRRAEIVAGVTACAIALVAALLATRIGASPSSSAAPAASPRAAPAVRPPAPTSTGSISRGPASSAAHARPDDDLLQHVPPSWRPHCHRAGTGAPSAPSALVCAPAAGIVVDVRRVSTSAATTSLSRLDAGAAPPANLPCARGSAALPAWSVDARPRASVGHVLCFVSARGAQLAWSIDSEGLVMHALRVDGNLRRLFTWWVGTTF